MAKKMTPKATTIQNREDLERVMGELALATIARGQIALAMDARLSEVRKDYEGRLCEFDAELETLAADLEAWAVLHPAEFAKAKSIQLVHGVIGFRTGMPALRTLKGVRWDDVLSQLRNMNLRDYIRTTQEVDKDTILAQREKISPDCLASMGMRVEQQERFYAEPKIEAEV